MCDLLVARQNVRITSGGSRMLLQRGTVVCSDDPIVTGRENLFRRLDVAHHCGKGTVEQATAAPGEKRDLDLPATRKVREWARVNGYDVPERGKLPADVLDAYRAAHAEGD